MRIILKHILKKQDAKCDCIDLVQDSHELQTDFQRCLMGLSGRIKNRGIFDQMSDQQLPKKDPTPEIRFALVLFLDLRMRAVLSNSR